MKNIMFIAIGGAGGSLLRYVINHLALWSTFPWWTLIVNSSGSFLLGLLTGYALIHKLPEHWQLGLGVGFCGGFTTMSTFAFDTAYLFQAFPPMYVAMYVSCSVMLGFFLVMFGIYAGDRLATRRGVS